MAGWPDRRLCLACFSVHTKQQQCLPHSHLKGKTKLEKLQQAKEHLTMDLLAVDLELQQELIRLCNLPLDEVLSMQDAANLLGVELTTLKRNWKQWQLKKVKHSNSRRVGITRQSLVDYLRRVAK